MSGNQQQAELIDNDAARKNARRITIFTVALLVVATAIGLGVGLLRSNHKGHHYGVLAGLLIAIVVIAVVAVITIPLMLRMYRRPNYARLLQYSWGRRRRVGKALRKGRPIAAEDRPVADAVVRTMRQQRWVPYLIGALVAFRLIQALFVHGFQRWLAIGLVVLYLILLPWLLWLRRTVFANYSRLEPLEGSETEEPR